MTMHPTTGRKKRWSRVDLAGIALCLAIALAWYLTTVGPLLKQRFVTAGLRRKIAEQQEKAEQSRMALASTQHQLAVVRRDLATRGVQLDSAAHINRRIAVLTEFFADCTLHIDDVQTGRISSGPQCDLVPITIVGRGAYPQCVRFLHGLCARFPDMSVMRIELRGTPARTVEPEQFRFEMFWYAAPKSAIQAVASGS